MNFFKRFTQILDERDWVDWMCCALVRAVKTFAQSLLATIAVGSALEDIHWATVLSLAGTASLLSLLTSVVGLPEEGQI